MSERQSTSCRPVLAAAQTTVPALVQRECACGGPAGLDAQCESCREEELTGKAAPLQAKLRVGPADDPYERQADRVADAVMRMPAAGAPGFSIEKITPLVQRQPVEAEEEEVQTDRLQRQPLEEEEEELQAERLQRQPLEEEEEELQMKRAPGGGGRFPNRLAGSYGSGGRVLPSPVRAFFEPRLGFDLSTVRVHNGADAAASARSVGARAYTVGRNVVFGAGQWAPGTAAGRRLIAHELTHVVQQGTSPGAVHRVQRQSESGSPTAAAASPCEPDRSLAWTDFAGAPKAKSKFAAYTKFSFEEAASKPKVRYKVVFDSTTSWGKAKFKTPDDRKLTGCGQAVTSCEKFLEDNPGGSWSLSGGSGSTCAASPKPDTSIEATTVAECDSEIGAECDRVSGLESARLLAHEQLHFDIPCVMVKKANAAIAASEPADKTKATLETKVDTLGKDYDKDSHHGCDAAKQSAWETKVASGLPKETIP